jgi:nucleoside-diphosphate-sugar epimerase
MGYKKVLVTGGAGFVGSSVAEALLRRGDDVVIVDPCLSHPLHLQELEKRPVYILILGLAIHYIDL